MTDYYEILGVSKDATKDEIKSAFRKMARKYHPDVNKAPDAEAKFKELGKAYETLMDDNKRATYDRFGEEGLQNAGYSTQGPFAEGFGDLNDVFESFFGGFGFSGSRRVDPNAPTRGENLRLDIELEFEEEALRKIAALTHNANEKVEDIGARRLHTVIERVLEDISFECSSGKAIITAALVEEKLADVAQNQDLAKYILQKIIYLEYLDIEDMEHQNLEKKKINMSMLKNQIYIMKKKLAKFQNIKD